LFAKQALKDNNPALFFLAMEWKQPLLRSYYWYTIVHNLADVTRYLRNDRNLGFCRGYIYTVYTLERKEILKILKDEEYSREALLKQDFNKLSISISRGNYDLSKWLICNESNVSNADFESVIDTKNDELINLLLKHHEIPQTNNLIQKLDRVCFLSQYSHVLDGFIINKSINLITYILRKDYDQNVRLETEMSYKTILKIITNAVNYVPGDELVKFAIKNCDIELLLFIENHYPNALKINNFSICEFPRFDCEY
jgi:hypothetical protein